MAKAPEENPTRRKMPGPDQTSLVPENPPKPTDGAKKPPKHNAELTLTEIDGKLRKFHVLDSNGEFWRIKLDLQATIDFAAPRQVPKEIHESAMLLWKATGAVEHGKHTDKSSFARTWARQVYSFHAPKAEPFMPDGIHVEAEVAGTPRVEIAAKTGEVLIVWSVEVQTTIEQSTALLRMRAAHDFVLSTATVQTDIEEED